MKKKSLIIQKLICKTSKTQQVNKKFTNKEKHVMYKEQLKKHYPKITTENQLRINYKVLTSQK